MLFLYSNSKRALLQIITATTGLLLLGCHFACGNKPPVRVAIWGDTAKIDVETLGEYPTTIVHVRLQDGESHGTVWEIEANSGTPQLHGLTLKQGDNSVFLAAPSTGTYEVVYPLHSKVFHLKQGVRYKLELWKDATSSPARLEIQFSK